MNLLPSVAFRTCLLFLLCCIFIPLTIKAQSSTGSDTSAVRRDPPYFRVISDDGKWLLYSIRTKTGKITYVHDLANNNELKQILPFAIESTAFTKDGRKVFLLHSKTFWKSKLAVYDTGHWHLLGTRSITKSTNSVAVNAEGLQLLAAAGSVVREIDPRTLKTTGVHWEISKLKGLVFNPTDQHQYAGINQKNVIEVRDLEKDRVLYTFRSGGEKIRQISYAPDGEHLMTTDDAGHSQTWDLKDRLGLTGLDGGIAIVPIPTIDYRPETKLVLGLTMSFIFRPHVSETGRNKPLVRSSSITPSLFYSFRGQLQGGLTTDYFSRHGWHFLNEVGFVRNNLSYFFGLGNDANKAFRTEYRNRVFSWEGELTKSIGHRFFAGIRYQVRNDSQPDFSGPVPPTVRGSDGGFLAGAGAVLRLDTRNDLFLTTEGYYADLSLTRYGEWLGSDYGYSELKIDYRGYHPLPILTTGTTFAFQVLYHGTFNGDAPFYQLPYLSADHLLRGVWRNLYIDRQAISLQGELRSNFSNIDQRYGYVLFVGAGDVAPNFFKGYDPDVIGVFGTGLRQQVVPKLKLQSRVDFAVTTKGNIGIFGGIGLTF